MSITKKKLKSWRLGIYDLNKDWEEESAEILKIDSAALCKEFARSMATWDLLWSVRPDVPAQLKSMLGKCLSQGPRMMNKALLK